MSERKTIRVRDVMDDRFVVIDGLKTVKEALEIIAERGAMPIIVAKRKEGDEYGIVLLADIAKKVLARDRSPERVNIYEIMSKPVVSVPPDMDVRYCARMFDQFGLSVAPVAANGEILGMVGYQGLVMDGLVKLYE